MKLEDFLISQVGHERPRPGLDRIGHYTKLKLKKSGKDLPLIVTIAGTNGKGQTALALSHLCQLKGVSYCLWTSPHITNITERFQSHQGELSEDRLKELILINLELVKEHKIVLTYYELLFLCFVDFIIDLAPQVVILEVGLGGRLDAVNVLDATMAVITSISRDHQEFLGNRYDLILAEKYAVSRPQGKLYSALELKYLREKLSLKVTKNKQVWFDLFEHEVLNLESDFVTRNLMLAIKVFDGVCQEIGLELLDQNAALNYLQTQKFKARLEQLSFRGAKFIFTGSHNLDGMRKLVQFLTGQGYNLAITTTLCSFSKRNPGELEQMLAVMARNEKLFGRSLFTLFAHPKAMRREDVLSDCPFVDWKKFLESEDIENQTILITGSYYFVGEVQSYIHFHNSL